MSAYYNDTDPYVCQWLRNLIATGLIAPGDVDERSITEVRADDIRGYSQCHWFAGIGGWSIALRLAGWPDGEPCWTGSCPCQPLSSAGQRKGHVDERHLWPAFHGLISECRPATVFGEQVAGKDGREWLAAVRADLEASGYACGCANLPAASIGAPHIRERLWFVANASSERCGEEREYSRQSSQRFASSSQISAPVANTDRESIRDARCGTVAGPDGSGKDQAWEWQRLRSDAFASGTPVADANRQGLEVPFNGNPGERAAAFGSGGFWAIEPDVGRVAHGIPARASKLRAYGNAIVPQVAAEFIGAFMDVQP